MRYSYNVSVFQLLGPLTLAQLLFCFVSYHMFYCLPFCCAQVCGALLLLGAARLRSRQPYLAWC